jgi:hypothetical protein
MAEPPTRRALRRNRPALGALVVAGVIAAPGLSTGAGAASTHRAGSHGPIITTGHAPLMNCPAPDVLMTVRLARHSYARGAPVDVSVTVRNVGPTTCHYLGSQSGASGVQGIGPCGMFGIVVRNASGANVWPGGLEFGCPLLLSATLAPGQTVHAQGGWDQVNWRHETGHSGGGPPTVPKGRYRMVIDRKISVNFTID